MTIIVQTSKGVRLATKEEKERHLLLARRQAILIELGSIEDYLGMERTVVPKHLREKENSV